jgi:hypothetical protein
MYIITERCPMNDIAAMTCVVLSFWWGNSSAWRVNSANAIKYHNYHHLSWERVAWVKVLISVLVCNRRSCWNCSRRKQSREKWKVGVPHSNLNLNFVSSNWTMRRLLVPRPPWCELRCVILALWFRFRSPVTAGMTILTGFYGGCIWTRLF